MDTAGRSDPGDSNSLRKVEWGYPGSKGEIGRREMWRKVSVSRAESGCGEVRKRGTRDRQTTLSRATW